MLGINHASVGWISVSSSQRVLAAPRVLGFGFLRKLTQGTISWCNRLPSHVSKFIVVSEKKKKSRLRTIISSDQRAMTLPSHKSLGRRTFEAMPGWHWWCNVLGVEVSFIIVTPVRWCRTLPPRYFSSPGTAGLAFLRKDSWELLFCKTWFMSHGRHCKSKALDQTTDLNQGW